MSAHRFTVEHARLVAAWESAGRLQDVADALGCGIDTARRLCREAKLDTSQRHWLDKVALGGAGGEGSFSSAGEEPSARVESDKLLRKAKDEGSQYKRLYEAALDGLLSQEALINAVVDACALELEVPTFRLSEPSRDEARKPLRDVVAQLSDWHIGQLVTSLESGTSSEYNTRLFLAYLESWAQKTYLSMLNMSRSYYIRRLVFAFCGDLVEGHDVFSGQAYHLEIDAAVQVVFGADAFARVLLELMGRLREALPWLEFVVVAVPGNHGKPGGRKGGATPVTYNFDWLFYKWLERELADAPLRAFVIEPAGRLMFETAGQTFLMTHGNEVRGWGGFPYYGLDKADGRLMRELGEVYGYWLLAHWHQGAALPAGEGHRLVNGSAVGANQLTRAATLLSTSPMQNLHFISNDFGLGEYALIYLSDRRKQPPRVHRFDEGEAA